MARVTPLVIITLTTDLLLAALRIFITQDIVINEHNCLVIVNMIGDYITCVSSMSAYIDVSGPGSEGS